jgi:arylsulfatase A-like enzyme
LPLLAERFREAGFQTAAFVDAAWLDPRHGVGRGFDLYDYRPIGSERRRGAARGLARLVDWLREAEARPAFVFWHLMDVHAPYGAPAPHGGSRGRSDPATPIEAPLAGVRGIRLYDHLHLDRFRTSADLRAAYDEAVAGADAAVGELLEGLRRAGLYDEALVAVVSDHGETLFEHGGWLTHGLLLAESEIRVPWILKLPGRRHAGRRVEEMVRLIDVAPTLLEASGIEPPESFRGRSLLAALEGGEGFPRVGAGYSDNTGAFYVRTARWKLVTAATRPAEEIASVFLRAEGGVPEWLPTLLGEQLYDLENDPGERRNRIADAPPEIVAELRELAARHIARAARSAAELAADPAAPVEIPPEERARLRALGYLQ